MAKNRWAAVVAGAACALLCARAPLFAEGRERTRIVASFYPAYIMALNVAGGIDGVTVSALTPPVTGCLHDYALTTDDMRKLADADVFIANGAGMESFLQRVVEQFPGLKVVTLSDGIPLILGRDGREGNPHVWAGVSGAIAQVGNLAAGLAVADPARARAYQENGAAYIGKLESLRARMVRELAPYAGRRIITFHEAFPYFAREFGLVIADVVEREPGSAPDARETAATIDLVRSAGITALFVEPQYPPAAAEAIARETGARARVLDPAVTGPDDPDAYIKIMEKNVSVLKDALGS